MFYEEDFSASFASDDGFDDDIKDIEDDDIDKKIETEEDDLDDEFNED